MTEPRATPWQDAADALKVSKMVSPFSTLIGALTPDRSKLRLGIMINGREATIVVPFSRAEEFFREVESLIKQKKAR
jgi:hypothetical protein